LRIGIIHGAGFQDHLCDKDAEDKEGDAMSIVRETDDGMVAIDLGDDVYLMTWDEFEDFAKEIRQISMKEED
jgi:hypothetical protein